MMGAGSYVGSPQIQPPKHIFLLLQQTGHSQFDQVGMARVSVQLDQVGMATVCVASYSSCVILLENNCVG